MLKLTNLIATLALIATPTLAQRTCTVTTYGNGCGPEMSASVRPNGGTVRVTLTVANAAPRTAVIMAIGDHRLDLPAVGAGLGCRWLVNPVFIQFHRTNAVGTFSHSRAISAAFLGTYHAQFVELSKTVLTSNGITLECK